MAGLGPFQGAGKGLASGIREGNQRRLDGTNMSRCCVHVCFQFSVQFCVLDSESPLAQEIMPRISDAFVTPFP